MFHSAVLKLTGWYLLILMVTSLVFSFTLYHEASAELHDRLSAFQSNIEQPGAAPQFDPNHRLFTAFGDTQRDVANRNILAMLIYVNLMILFGGGILSYLLARRTLAQIEQSHDAQSRFTSDASHELRTPLAAMKAELEVALRDPKLSKSDMQELLQSNLEEVEKLTVLSKTLLQLSKLDHANLEMEIVSFNDIASEVVQKYDKNLTRIKLKLSKQPLNVKANVASLEELVTILVDNALKYSPAKSQISAVLSLQGRHAQFEITNGGKGIASDKLARIFERFYRANESRTDEGSGLGLALASEIVTMHRGELSVSSSEGGDTIFTVLLPAIRKN